MVLANRLNSFKPSQQAAAHAYHAQHYAERTTHMGGDHLSSIEYLPDFIGPAQVEITSCSVTSVTSPDFT